ncbi:TadE/TadG family type IV pilus assembly protein [Tropicibacter oceani]|uniref:TadE/TadG family type IV pilus assembly protein n=1 Tax=Tropicibacter oceani TaxID=3058420 RepID=A0ABY8QIN4_9RHOB|nr:TadE/TadG family type IV pilus assembly protein [Tropicibacter oceani]WGW03848.1 TadE/TadG family type IV pilus assembly protein [Tropicibacter oceani]
MMCFVKKALRGFARDEAGSMVVPFALWTPVFLGLILSAVELGTVTVRQTALERALDDAVRDLRLDVASDVSHDALKSRICQGAAILPGCEDMLRLEMVSLDMRSWSAPPTHADCVDVSQEVNPVRGFYRGGEQAMMLLRACYKYQPITPAGTLSSSLAKDDAGYTAIVAATAFVHEPL